MDTYCTIRDVTDRLTIEPDEDDKRLIGARIKTIFDDEHGLYGAKRIAASLKEDPGYTPGLP